jgi:hypothetical protein
MDGPPGHCSPSAAPYGAAGETRADPRRGVTLRFRAVLLAIVIGDSLVACSSSGRAHPPSAPATSKRPTSPSHIPSQHPLPNPSQITNSVKLRQQVAITGCTATPDGWRATGSAVNSGAKPHDFEITVFFTTTSATVLDYARTTVKVPPGQTGKWTASATFKAEPNMRCVLRGVG